MLFLLLVQVEHCNGFSSRMYVMSHIWIHQFLLAWCRCSMFSTLVLVWVCLCRFNDWTGSTYLLLPSLGLNAGWYWWWSAIVVLLFEMQGAGYNMIEMYANTSWCIMHHLLWIGCMIFFWCKTQIWQSCKTKTRDITRHETSEKSNPHSQLKIKSETKDGLRA